MTLTRSLNKSIDAAIEPVSLTAMKSYLRVDFNEDDGIITSMIKAARIALENYMNRALISQTWVLTFDDFPLSNAKSAWWDGVKTGSRNDLITPLDAIVIPMGRILAVSEFKTYLDDNTSAIFDAAAYLVDTSSEPGRVVLNDGYVWPSDLRSRNAVQITFTAGYGTNATDVPEDIRIAIQMQAADYYEKRCTPGSLSEGVIDIIKSYKIYAAI